MTGFDAEAIVGRLRQLNLYAEGLQGIITRVQAGAPLARGVDGSGAVEVVLGTDGLPHSFRVEADWVRRLAAGRACHAVMEAYCVAAGNQMEARSRALEDEGLRSDADHLREDLDGGILAAASQASGRSVPDVSGVRPRSIEALAEDLLAAMGRVEDLAAASTMEVTGVGSDASRRLTMTVSAGGLVGCSADSDWISRQTGSGLTTALGEALAAARSDLARAAENANPVRQLDGLVFEALAALSDPERITRS